jgi:hypothetical protein
VSSMNDVVGATGALGDHIDRCRQQASSTVAHIDQTRAQLQDLGAKAIAEGLVGLRARMETIDMLLVQASVRAGEAKREAFLLGKGDYVRAHPE